MPLFHTSTLRARNILVAVAALLTLQVFAVAVSGVSARDSAVAAAREGIIREGQTTTESILRHLEPAEQSVEVTSRLLQADLIETSNSGLERYLFTQLAVMPQVTGAFVGYPSGDFVFVAVDGDGDGFQTKRVSVEPERRVEVERYDRDFERTSTEEVIGDSFDPRQRPWFEQAVETGEVAWTDPYVFFSSQQPGVTVSAPVVVDGEVTAVVGVDVELSGLAAFLDELNVSAEGEAFVVSGDTVIGAPSAYRDRTGTDADGNLRLLTMSELGVPQIAAASSFDVQRLDVDGRTDLVLSSDFPASEGLGWGLVVRAPEQSFTAISSDQQRTTLLVTLGGGVLVMLGILALVRVSRPITQIQTWATTDALTGVANRRTIDERGPELLAAATENGALSVMLLDLDGFKKLNDVCGHHTGDRALAIVGEVLAAGVSDDDLVGRLGGDEFVIARHVSGVDAAVDAAGELLDDLRTRVAQEIPGSPVGVSAGLTIGFDAGAEFASLLIEADAALIAAKTDHKGTLHLADRVLASSP